MDNHNQKPKTTEYLGQSSVKYSSVEQHSVPPTQTKSSEYQDNRNKFKRNNIMSSARGILSVAGYILGAYLLALFLSNHVFQSYQVVGESMSPTLHTDDWLIVNKAGASWADLWNNDYTPSRGDVILFTDPRPNQEKTLIKRVIALPGETVELVDGNLVVKNDEFPLGFDPDKDYKEELFKPTSSSSLRSGPITVPEGEVFVSGDNRAPGGSEDSRGSLGTVPFENIIGELSLRLLPLGDLDFTF